jgi:GntR family transcriptional regulator
VSLAFSISPASDVPIFRQIVQQVHQAVATGRLEVGEQLPAVRILAEELVLNANTVARSYQELIREGVLESRSGRGVFVAERRKVFSDAERTRRLRHVAEQLCHEAILFGSDLPEVRSVVEGTWRDLQRETRTVGRPPEERKKK